MIQKDIDLLKKITSEIEIIFEKGEVLDVKDSSIIDSELARKIWGEAIDKNIMDFESIPEHRRAIARNLDFFISAAHHFEDILNILHPEEIEDLLDGKIFSPETYFRYSRIDDDFMLKHSKTPDQWTAAMDNKMAKFENGVLPETFIDSFFKQLEVYSSDKIGSEFKLLKGERMFLESFTYNSTLEVFNRYRERFIKLWEVGIIQDVPRVADMELLIELEKKKPEGSQYRAGSFIRSIGLGFRARVAISANEKHIDHFPHNHMIQDEILTKSKNLSDEFFRSLLGEFEPARSGRLYYIIEERQEKIPMFVIKYLVEKWKSIEPGDPVPAIMHSLRDKQSKNTKIDWDVDYVVENIEYFNVDHLRYNEGFEMTPSMELLIKELL